MQLCYPFLNPLTKWIDGVILHAKLWRHNMNNLHHTFGTMLIPIAIFRYGLTLFVYLPPVVIFPLFLHFEWDTLNKWYFLQMLFDFYYFSVTLSIKIGKIITYSEGTSACTCLIWEGKGHLHADLTTLLEWNRRQIYIELSRYSLQKCVIRLINLHFW